jgi:succinyl-CoA synthetase beta subunit
MTRGARQAIAKCLAKACREGRRGLSEPETKQILALAGVPLPRERMVQNNDEAVRAAREFGFPVALKIVSPDIPHKSDVGGVVVNIDSPRAMRRAYCEIVKSVASRCSTAHVTGMLVQEMARGFELIAGSMTDRHFGPVVMFGLGGMFAEIFDDVTFRVVPILRSDANEMLDEIKASSILNGPRGLRKAHRARLISVLLRLSELAGCFRDWIREIDINPLVLSGRRCVAVDALLILH